MRQSRTLTVSDVSRTPPRRRWPAREKRSATVCAHAFNICKPRVCTRSTYVHIGGGRRWGQGCSFAECGLILMGTDDKQRKQASSLSGEICLLLAGLHGGLGRGWYTRTHPRQRRRRWTTTMSIRGNTTLWQRRAHTTIFPLRWGTAIVYPSRKLATLTRTDACK